MSLTCSFPVIENVFFTYPDNSSLYSLLLTVHPYLFSHLDTAHFSLIGIQTGFYTRYNIIRQDKIKSNKVKQKLTHQKLGKNQKHKRKKIVQEKAQEQNPTCSYTQESHRNTAVEAIIYTTMKL